MSQPPSNLPPGLSFARRTTAPVKLPRLDFPRLGGPVESQPARLGELAPDTSSGATVGQRIAAFPQPEPQPLAPTPSYVSPPASFTASPIGSSNAMPSNPAPTGPVQLGEPAPITTVKEEPFSMMTSSGATIPDAREAAKVIVYGRSGSSACMRAIQDLMERQVSFQYVDVSRDSAAAAHLAAICNGEPVVPVIVHIGFGGA